jgi:hypothetical protein
MKTMSDKEKEKFAAEAIAADGDQEKWEKGELGRDPNHVEAGGCLKGNKVFPTSIRLPYDLVQELRAIAKTEGLAYQSLIRMVLTRYVRNVRAKTG